LPTSRTVTLENATPDMAALLSNLLEVCVHDLSEISQSTSGLMVALGTGDPGSIDRSRERGMRASSSAGAALLDCGGYSRLAGHRRSHGS
jgi:hypothetical protein